MSQVIYTTTAIPAKINRKRLAGIAASAFKGGDGRWHTYLNAAVPICQPPATLDDSLCRCCRLGYSHVMSEKREICNECIGERIAEAALNLQAEAGIDLGWQMPEDYRPAVMRQVSIGERWGMHRVRRQDVGHGTMR